MSWLWSIDAVAAAALVYIVFIRRPKVKPRNAAKDSARLVEITIKLNQMLNTLQAQKLMPDLILVGGGLWRYLPPRGVYHGIKVKEDSRRYNSLTVCETGYGWELTRFGILEKNELLEDE